MSNKIIIEVMENDSGDHSLLISSGHHGVRLCGPKISESETIAEFELEAQELIYQAAKLSSFSEWVGIHEQMPNLSQRVYVRYESPVGPQSCIAQYVEYDPCAPSDRRVREWQYDRGRSIEGGGQKVTHWHPLPPMPTE